MAARAARRSCRGASLLSRGCGELVPKNGGAAEFSLLGVGKGLQRRGPLAPRRSSAQLNQQDLTEMAWEGIVDAVNAARLSKQQVVETEHLMKALLEKKNGLARRIFAKAGTDNTSVLQATDEFMSKQPKVIGDTSRPVMGTFLQSLLGAAKKHQKDLGDDYLSVEHLILAFLSDKRFGQELLKKFQLGKKELKDAITAVHGNQRVTKQYNTSSV